MNTKAPEQGRPEQEVKDHGHGTIAMAGFHGRTKEALDMTYFIDDVQPRTMARNFYKKET